MTENVPTGCVASHWASRVRGPDVGATASIDGMMERVMVQADKTLLERARRAARERGVTFPQLVREALEHELTTRTAPARSLSCVGAIDTGGQARQRAYEPDPWR